MTCLERRKKDGGRGKDQMGRGGTEPRRAGIKERGCFGFFCFFLKCVKRETGDERETQALERERGGCK